MHSKNSFCFLSHGQTSSRCCSKKLWLPEASRDFGVIEGWEAFTCRIRKGFWWLVYRARCNLRPFQQECLWDSPRADAPHTLHKVGHPWLPFELVKSIVKKLSQAHLLSCSPLSFSLAWSLPLLKHELYWLTPDLSRNMCFIQHTDLVYRKKNLFQNMEALNAGVLCTSPLEWVTSCLGFPSD